MFVLSDGNSTGTIVKSLRNDDVIISTIHYPVEECRQGMHYHENPHVCFLFQGADIESRGNRSYERKTGEIYFYRAGEKHASVSRRSMSKNTNLEFGKAFLEKYGCSESQLDRSLTNSLDAKFLIMQIQRETLIGDDVSPLAIQTLLLNLISCSDGSLPSASPKWVLPLEDLLHEKWNETVTLNELSSATNAHPVTISKNFRRYFSCTLGEYMRKLKVDHSIPLIKNSDMSLTEIALHCGFADQSHFTRTFLRTTGFLPKDFRRI